MEPQQAKSKLNLFYYEFVGTALLMYCANMSIDQEAQSSYKPLNPTQMGIAYAVAVILFGDISNGHFNPAITVGAAILENEGLGFVDIAKTVFVEVVSQVLGAVFGVAIVYLNNLRDYEGKTILPGIALLVSPVDGYGDKESDGKMTYHAFLAEVLLTFIFVSIVLAVKRVMRPEDLLTGALAMGLALYCTASVAVRISGASLNPAKGLVQPIFQRLVMERFPQSYPDYSRAHARTGWFLLYYAVAPLLGGIGAGLWQKFTTPPAKKYE